MRVPLHDSTSTKEDPEKWEKMIEDTDAIGVRLAEIEAARRPKASGSFLPPLMMH
jgi:hypothetical protein